MIGTGSSYHVFKGGLALIFHGTSGEVNLTCSAPLSEPWILFSESILYEPFHYIKRRLGLGKLQLTQLRRRRIGLAWKIGPKGSLFSSLWYALFLFYLFYLFFWK